MTAVYVNKKKLLFSIVLFENKRKKKVNFNLADFRALILSVCVVLQNKEEKCWKQKKNYSRQKSK